MQPHTLPTLAAPGAGLPFPELLIGRLLFGLRRRLGNAAAFAEKFSAERAAIRLLVDSCVTTRLAERVLIKRLRGLEDSSRHWSVWMTLDHLRITNLAFARFITGLAQGVTPDVVVSTANVKPAPDVTASIDAGYEQSCDQVLVAMQQAGDTKSVTRHAHPWFGPLDVAGWQALAGGHMGIHRAQLAAIIQGLA